MNLFVREHLESSANSLRWRNNVNHFFGQINSSHVHEKIHYHVQGKCVSSEVLLSLYIFSRNFNCIVSTALRCSLSDIRSIQSPEIALSGAIGASVICLIVRLFVCCMGIYVLHDLP